MPKITCSLKDLQTLTRRTLTEEKLRELLRTAKAELEEAHNDELSISFGDTNQPHLWSTEGLARHLKGVLEVEAGIASCKIEKPTTTVLVDASVTSIRPYIATFLAKGPALTEQLLIQLIQLQEKLAENYGRKRSKISIGLYPAAKIQFPVTYKAVDPDSTKFIPLEGRTPLNLRAILREHPKGIAYASILANAKKYPVLLDANKQVLSLAPIINSETTGKLSPGETSIFFDATGTDKEAVDLCASIMAFALADRGYIIQACTVKYGKTSTQTPSVQPRKMRFDMSYVQKILGINLSQAEVKQLLRKARLDYQAPHALLPAYRNDFMHAVDVVEEVAIMKGYDTIPSSPVHIPSIARALPQRGLANAARTVLAGLGMQEVLSPLLSNKDVLAEKMQAPDKNIVELSNPVSITYSTVRSWLLPLLLEALSKNKHVEYPQKLFEHGLVTLRSGELVWDEEHIAGISTHASADYTETRQHAEHVLRSLGVQYTITDYEHQSFIQGRCAEIKTNEESIGFFGELHPAVLKRFGLEQPTAGFEINMTKIQEMMGKKEEKD